MVATMTSEFPMKLAKSNIVINTAYAMFSKDESSDFSHMSSVVAVEFGTVEEGRSEGV